MPSAGPAFSTSDIAIDGSPLMKCGLSRPPLTAIPNPYPGTRVRDTLWYSQPTRSPPYTFQKPFINLFSSNNTFCVLSVLNNYLFLIHLILLYTFIYLTTLVQIFFHSQHIDSFNFSTDWKLVVHTLNFFRFEYFK